MRAAISKSSALRRRAARPPLAEFDSVRELRVLHEGPQHSLDTDPEVARLGTEALQARKRIDLVRAERRERAAAETS